MGERRGAYRALVGKPEGRRPLGRPRQRWEDNIKMDVREVGCGGMDWINIYQKTGQKTLHYFLQCTVAYTERLFTNDFS
jgi:hypothetical protein